MHSTIYLNSNSGMSPFLVSFVFKRKNGWWSGGGGGDFFKKSSIRPSLFLCVNLHDMFYQVMYIYLT